MLSNVRILLKLNSKIITNSLSMLIVFLVSGKKSASIQSQNSNSSNFTPHQVGRNHKKLSDLAVCSVVM